MTSKGEAARNVLSTYISTAIAAAAGHPGVQDQVSLRAGRDISKAVEDMIRLHLDGEADAPYERP